MADSRFASLRLYFQDRWPIGQKLTSLLGIFFLALLLRWVAQAEGIPQITYNALFLLVFAAGLWITEAIPPFSVSILIIGFAIYFLDDIGLNTISKDWQQYLGTWSSPIIWILLGGFFLAIGAQITQFDHVFSRIILTRFGNKPSNLLLGCMLTTGVLSMFMSNTATSAMMVAVVTPLARDLDQKDPFIKALFLGIAAAATVGGMGTIIGSPPNAIAVGSLQNEGIDFGFAQWMLLGSPIAMIFIFAIWFLLKSRFKSSYKELDMSSLTEIPTRSVRNTYRNRAAVVVTFIITIGAWLSSPFHDIPVAVISFLPVLTFTVSGVVTAQDLRLLPWDTLILVAGGLTLGISIADSGLDRYLVAKIPIFDNTIVMLLILAVLTTTLSNIMSNTASASVLIPVGISFLPEHALLVALVIGFSASTALFLPISTPPNAISFSTGYLKQSDFRYLGIVIGLLGPAFIVIIAKLAFAIGIF